MSTGRGRERSRRPYARTIGANRREIPKLSIQLDAARTGVRLVEQATLLSQPIEDRQQENTVRPKGEGAAAVPVTNRSPNLAFSAALVEVSSGIDPNLLTDFTF